MKGIYFLCGSHVSSLCSTMNTLGGSKRHCVQSTFIFITLFEPHTNLDKKVSQDLEAFIMPVIQMDKLRLGEIKLLT